jgi:hypothetical protein
MWAVFARKGASRSYLEETEERSAELLEHMVDLLVQLVGLEERAPPLENGVCNLQHTDVGGRVIRQLRNEILKGGRGTLANATEHSQLYYLLTSTRVSQRSQKSLSAITLTASPS